MKSVAIIIALAMSAATPIAFAGVAPNSAASAAAQSGARVAPAKSNPQSESQGDNSGQSDTAK